MKDHFERLKNLSVVPSEQAAFVQWLKGQDALGFLKDNLRDDEFVLYAGAGLGYINTVLVPSSRVEPPDPEDLRSWNFGLHDGWGVSVTFGSPPTFTLTGSLDHTGTRTFEGGQQLIFLRSFEGRMGDDKSYWELYQPLAHVFGLHYLDERQAYCRIDRRGDVEDLVRVVRVPPVSPMPGGTVITIRRSILDEWMLLTGTTALRTFDFTRYRPGQLAVGRGFDEPTVAQEDEIFYRFATQRDEMAYVRGCQVVRSRATLDDLNRRFGMGGREERQYESFLALDFKNQVIREISTAPSATANYFTVSDLPFETSPAFFRPEVLMKYKADKEKYRLENRSLHCRNAWYLKTFDINDAGQLHTYIVYLGDLPFEEQQYWKAFNEEPKGGLSARAIKTDFEGRWDLEYEPLSSLKDRLEKLGRHQVPWWKARSANLAERVHYPVTGSADEWADEIGALDQFVVEGFVSKWLREKAESLGRSPAPKLGSLKLVEECLVGRGFKMDDARRLTSPLHELHDYRSKAGKTHAGGQEATEIRKGVLRTHGTYAKHFRNLAAQCDEAIKAIAEAFKGLS